MQWHDVRKTTVTIDLPTRELWPGTSTGILMNPTARKLPRVRYFTDEPITEDQRQSQRDDPELRPGTMLIATQNFNVQGEPESCMGGIYQEVDQNLEKGVLEVRKGDLIRFNGTTDYAHLCVGELIRNTSTTPLTNHVLRKPLFGLFDVTKCVYAKADIDQLRSNPQDVAMWQRYADYTATDPRPTSNAQEEAELRQAMR